ncbi:MAG: hypothetical protein GXP44_01485, partial [bacterium]|nr:hypothetical protein [bacterium]
MTEITYQNISKETDNLKEKSFSFNDLDNHNQQKIKDLISNKEKKNFVVKNGGLLGN